MFLKSFLPISLVLLLSAKVSSQTKNQIEFAFNSGINNTTISKGMKGFYMQSSLSKSILNPVWVRFSIGAAKSSDYPKKFSYELRPFTLRDTMLGHNLELWNLIKNETYQSIDVFGFTHATNIYISLNTDIRFFKIHQFSCMGTIGINYISTFGTTLYLKDVSFRNGKIVSFTPTAYFDKDNLIGFNTGIKFLYSLKNNWGVTLGADKYFGDNGSPYSKSDWISIGLGITKRLDLKCKKQN